MKKIKTFCFFSLLIMMSTLSAQIDKNQINLLLPTEESIHTKRDYSFNIYDGVATSFTMRQFNQNFVETNRFAMRALDDVLGIPFFYLTISTYIKLALPTIITIPITHEEGHRSILTAQNIGSISQPFANSSGACYVKGVTDNTLQNLRDTNLPVFIRMHTAGIESDYMICNRENELISYRLDLYQNVGFDLLFRNLMNVSYLSDGLTLSIRNHLKIKTNSKIEKEEINELDRDIVGHDVFGMIYHLYRPEEVYSRYKNYHDLNKEERNFANRIGYRSLLNLLNTVNFTGQPLQLSEQIYISGNMGYCIAPFGDFINENIYLKYDNFNIGVYARQAQNRKTWFPAAGVSLVDYKPFEWLSLTGRGHFWIQPKGLDFNTSKTLVGGAVEFEARGFFPNRNLNSSLKSMGLSIGCLYKTAGFMPEIESHKQKFSINTGIVFKH